MSRSTLDGPRLRTTEHVSKPQYRYAHQQERKRWAPIVERGEAMCSEPVCVKPSRWIPPGSKWHLSHNPSGTHWIGPSHAACNGAENARRNNPKRATQRKRWVIP